MELSFGRCTSPRKWHGDIGSCIGQIAIFPAVRKRNLTTKARKTFFITRVRSQRAHRVPSVYADLTSSPYLKVAARTNHGNPAVPARQTERQTEHAPGPTPAPHGTRPVLRTRTAANQQAGPRFRIRLLYTGQYNKKSALPVLVFGKSTRELSGHTEGNLGFV